MATCPMIRLVEYDREVHVDWCMIMVVVDVNLDTIRDIRVDKPKYQLLQSPLAIPKTFDLYLP